MSHLHEGEYTDISQLIPYINGFLWPLEILNDEANHGQTYYVEEIERSGSHEASVKKHLLQPEYVITLEEKKNWKALLQETSMSFFESVLQRIELNSGDAAYAAKYNQTKRQLLNFTILNEKYLSLMSELIGENPNFYEVTVDWSQGAFYECYHKDYLVDNERGLFFIHFGTSD